MAISRERLLDAERELAACFAPTRLVRAKSLDTSCGEVYLKLESELPTGSFKVRGAVYSLSLNVRKGGFTEVVAASTGNHGAAVAYAGRRLGVAVTIFLPVRANPLKVAHIRAHGGRNVEAGTDISAAIDAAQEYSARAGAFFLHDASDPGVPVGAATIGTEILRQVPAVDVIYVPVGDSALIRGVASAVKALQPSVRIVGVVAERAPAYYLSWRNRSTVETDAVNTIADGLAVRRPLAANVAALCELVDDMRLVTEDEMLSAIKRLLTGEQVLAEPAAAAATAGFLKRPETTGTSVLLVTGANIAPGVLDRAMAFD